MNPLASIYGAGAGAKNLLYDRGILRTRRLKGPVISVGNLSVGGSGKTPFVLFLGGLLKHRGLQFDILSRGYGRETRGVKHVNPAGTSQEFGDEPLLMSRRLDVPIIVGESRYEAGMFAEERFGPQLHLLDDGFQHRSLGRDFDIVLLAPEDVNDRLLPAGRLREPLESLCRTDAVVITAGMSINELPLRSKLVWEIKRGLDPAEVPDRPVAFCGIARPKNFYSQLRGLGINPAAEASYRDHHAYTERDVASLLDLRDKNHAGGFVTTEKDAVNLGEWITKLDPIVAIPVRIELEDAANAVDTMLRTIRERRLAA